MSPLGGGFSIHRLRTAAGLTALAGAIAANALAGTALTSTAHAQGTDPPSAEEMGVESWALVDPQSGRYLEGEGLDERKAPAATASVMTALVALEETDDLGSEVAVPEEAEEFVGFTYSNVGLIAGERLSVRELLQATLISSGTDATYTLAEHLGSGDTQNFVDMMNDRASEMGLQNTRFTNPAGLDEEGNYSTAGDLAAIVTEAMKDPRFAGIVDTGETTISTESPVQNREIDLYNTNELLFAYPAVNGVKTGGSPQAGSSVIASAERGGKSYVAVVMGGGSAGEASGAAWSVLQHGFNAYEERRIVREGESLAELPLPYRSTEKVTLVAENEIEALAAPGSQVERRVSTQSAPEGASAGEELGSVEVFVEGDKVGESPLVTGGDYMRPSVWDKARLAALWPFEKLWSSLREHL